MRHAHKLASVLTGATLVVGTLAACTAAQEEPRQSCEAWVTDLGEGPIFGTLTVCDADTERLDPATDELMTVHEYRERQRIFAEDAQDALAGDTESSEAGMRPCADWAREDARDPVPLCMGEDWNPSTPVTESEYVVFTEIQDCWDYYMDTYEETERLAECTALIDDAPTLTELRDA